MSESQRFAVVETMDDDGEPECSVVPEKWLNNNRNSLLWPPSHASNKARKRVNPEQSWKAHPCKIIKGDIGELAKSQYTVINVYSYLINSNLTYLFSDTFNEAQELSRKRSLHNDTQSEEDAEAQRKRRRQNPVQHMAGFFEDGPDFNLAFETNEQGAFT